MSEDQILDLADRLEVIQDQLALNFKVQTQCQRLMGLILTRLDQIDSKELTQVATIQQVQEQVTRTDSVIDGAVILIGSIAQMLQEARDKAAGDPAALDRALDRVVNDLQVRTEALAQSIVRNTPSDPNPGQPVPTTGEVNQPVPTGPAPEGLPPPAEQA